jgi:predicted metal-dependent peptidase
MARYQKQLSTFETARAGLVKTKSLMFFASALLQTRFVEDKTCPTAWTDMTVIGYNPAFIEGLDMPTAKFVIIHELMHIILKHGLRRGSRDPVRFNEAADFAINIMLKDLGFSVWKWALIDPKYRGMTAEQIYALREQQNDKQGKGQGQGQGQGGKPEPGQGGLGSDLRPVPAATPEQAAAIDHEISKTIARATAIAKQHGVMPGTLEAVVSVGYEDPVPWETVLIDYLTASIAQDENWSRRNRRHSEVILPSYKSNGMDELTIVADSSGSMFTRKIFERVAVAVNHIVTVIKPMVVRVVWADDAECSNTDIFEDGEDVVLHPKGGGGTDLRKPLHYVAQFDPEVVLLLTDGYTPWDETPYAYPVIVGCTTDAPVPDWMGVVRIEVQ